MRADAMADAALPPDIEAAHKRRLDIFASLHHVPPEHRDIDAALERWAKWLRGSGTRNECPMFRLVRSSSARSEYGATTHAPSISADEALRTERAMRHLPALHRSLLQGWYMTNMSPPKLCRSVGIRYDELHVQLYRARSAIEQCVQQYG